MTVELCYKSLNTNSTQFVNIEPYLTIRGLATLIGAQEGVHPLTFHITSQGTQLPVETYDTKKIQDLSDFGQRYMIVNIRFSLSGWRKVYCLPVVYFHCLGKTYTLQSLEKGKTIAQIKEQIFATQCHEGCNDHPGGPHGLKNKIMGHLDPDCDPTENIELLLLGDDQPTVLIDDQTLNDSGVEENNVIEVVIKGADAAEMVCEMTATSTGGNNGGGSGAD